MSLFNDDRNIEPEDREDPEVSVEYIYNGISYVVKSDNRDSSLKIGEEIDFWYDPDDPYNVTAGKATLKGLNQIFSVFIIVFGALTIVMIRKVIVNAINKLRLLLADMHGDDVVIGCARQYK